MFDFAFSELLVVGAVALVVIGPERMPMVARTVGALLGKAQRYIQDVQTEVKRNIALDEIRSAGDGVQQGMDELQRSFQTTAAQMRQSLILEQSEQTDPLARTGEAAAAYESPIYTLPQKNWRARRGNTPQWYKSQAKTRRYAQSGAARVARHRPRIGQNF